MTEEGAGAPQAGAPQAGAPPAAAPPAAGPKRPGLRQQLGNAVKAARTLADRHGREDLTERLGTAGVRLQDPAVRVLVVGEYKHGKSTLINSLLTAPVCPVDDDVATSVPTEVRFAPEPVAAIVLEPDDGQEPRREAIPVEKIASFVTESGNPANARRVRMVQVGIPRALLQGGLVMVDTPGVGGLGSAHTAATLAALPLAGAVLFVSDAAQEYTASELEFLRTARRLCPSIVCVTTKIDLYPEWRRILEMDRGRLQEAGIAAPMVPVSSALRAAAVAAEDKAMNEESGFRPLVAWLNEQVVGGSERLAARAAAADVLSVLAQLEGSLGSERSALADPESAADLVGRLQEAKEAAERLRSETAKWQQTLGDGFADLGSDIDHDFRSRTRAVIEEAEEALDQSDPEDMWDEFQGWMERRLTYEVAENYAMLAQRTGEVGDRVSEHFRADENVIHEALQVATPEETMRSVRTKASVEAKRQGAVSQGLNVVRAGWGGVSMFGYMGGMVGMSMINPFTILVGVLMGGKAIKDERERALTMRRQQAKQALRKYVEDISFHVGKDSRDTVRRVQRELRDRFASRAEELLRSSGEALQGAQQAVQANQAERTKRLQELGAELQTIARLRGGLLQIVPELAAAMAAG